MSEIVENSIYKAHNDIRKQNHLTKKEKRKSEFEYLKFEDIQIKIENNIIWILEELKVNPKIIKNDSVKYLIDLLKTIIDENDELEIITVTSIEYVEEEANYYHVVSSQYYNIIANDIITTDGAVYLSNLYGFDENIKWPTLRDEIMSDPNNLYTYEDFEDIGMPRKMFDDLRVREGKYLATRYGITLEVFKA